MDVTCIGVDESVETVFPPEKLRGALSDVDAAVEIVDGSPESLVECDAVVTFVHRDEFVGTVDWVHSIQSGVDRFPFDEFEAAGVVLTNSTGIHGPAVGETVASHMLAFGRRLHRYVANQQRREWSQPAWDEGFTLAGESLCVVGLGTLGQGIVERADALGMTVTGVRRTPEPVDGVERVYPPADLCDAIADTAFVALAVPLTDETCGMIGAPEFEAMREDARLINVARGAVVDEAALVDALRAGEITGAALDVFEEEPLPEDSPLWGMDEVIVTPHCAALTRDYYRNVAELVRENVERIREGEELTNRVV